MHLLTAILYPFNRSRLNDTVKLPVLISAVYMALYLALYGTAFLLMFMRLVDEATMLPVVVGIALAMVGVSLVCLAPLMGYLWLTVGNWMQDGYEAEPPRWAGQWANHFKAGMHFYACMLLVALPSMLIPVTLGLATPLFVTPFLLASRQRTVMAFIRAIGPGFELARSNYIPLLLATYASLLIHVAFSIGLSLLSITVVGILASAAVMFWGMLASCQVFVQQLGVPAHTDTGHGPHADSYQGPSHDSAGIYDDGLPDGGVAAPVGFDEGSSGGHMMMVPGSVVGEGGMASLGALFVPRRIDSTGIQPENKPMYTFDTSAAELSEQASGIEAPDHVQPEADFGHEGSDNVDAVNVEGHAQLVSHQPEGSASLSDPSGSHDHGMSGERGLPGTTATATAANGLMTLTNNPWM
ncbi:MAG: hypothetical protein KC474_04790 [Cyanobacteria bacterium HKST-UBA04]|nr:hypothetical protein [Cyanobacteria bacterium HKST-UBA04]